MVRARSWRVLYAKLRNLTLFVRQWGAIENCLTEGWHTVVYKYLNTDVQWYNVLQL